MIANAFLSQSTKEEFKQCLFVGKAEGNFMSQSTKEEFKLSLSPRKQANIKGRNLPKRNLNIIIINNDCQRIFVAIYQRGI